MDEILIFLLRKGAHRSPVRLTTTQLGSELGMSQQNASRRMRELEISGHIERKDGGVVLTKKAQTELAELYAALKKAFENGTLEIHGTIVSGLGEGKYYLGLEGYRKQVKEKLGFVPYPGTLNLKLDTDEMWKREYFVQMEPIIINGFRDGERAFGDLFAYRCRVLDAGNRRLDADCAILVPLRTHHGPEIIEIIAAQNIKEKFRKKDGDSILVEL